ncbi:probable alpha,alpha-trehalose-phosphate synthase [UDP-forming] 11 [Tanacetum coccineum]
MKFGTRFGMAPEFSGVVSHSREALARTMEWQNDWLDNGEPMRKKWLLILETAEVRTTRSSSIVKINLQFQAPKRSPLSCSSSYCEPIKMVALPDLMNITVSTSLLAIPSAQTTKKVEELKKIYQGKTMILEVDDMDVFKVENETQKVANEVTERFSKDGYEPIVFVSGPVSIEAKVAYYAISECVIVNVVRDGIKSVTIVLEFIGCSPSLNGDIRVNPWNIKSVTEAMWSAITMSHDASYYC